MWDYLAVIAVFVALGWYRLTMSKEERLIEDEANKDLWI